MEKKSFVTLDPGLWVKHWISNLSHDEGPPPLLDPDPDIEVAVHWQDQRVEDRPVAGKPVLVPVLLNVFIVRHWRWGRGTSGLYYKPMTIVNDDSRVINKLEASLTDDAGVVIYDHHMFIVQATDCTIKHVTIITDDAGVVIFDRHMFIVQATVCTINMWWS